MADKSALLNTNRLNQFTTVAIPIVTSTGAFSSRVVSTSYVTSNHNVTNLLAGRLLQTRLDIFALSTAGVTAIQLQARWLNYKSTATYGPQTNTTQSSAVYLVRQETIHIASSAFATGGLGYAMQTQGDALQLNVRCVTAKGRIRVDSQHWLGA